MKIKSLIDIADKGTDGSVKWRLTRDCNFKCSYCVQSDCNNQVGFTNAKEDYEACFSVADEVNRCIEEMQSTKIRLFFIGGEVTMYSVEQLKTLLEKLSSKKIVQFYITTNFFRDVNYFVELEEYLKSRGIVFYLCCSWHAECLSFEEYSRKLLELREKTTIDFRCEKVHTIKNKENVEKLKEFCHEHKIKYLIDGDITRRNRNYYQYVKSEHYLREIPRYKAILEDGSVDYIQTRNSLMLGQIEKYKENVCEIGAFCTNGKYCTRDYDFLYFSRNFHNGVPKQGEKCRQFTLLDKDFHPLTEPQICTFKYCNLCGRLSVSDNKDDLKISIK